MKFLSFKQKKTVSLSEIHEAAPSPKKDWLVVVGACISIIVCILVVSYAFFYSFINESDPSQITVEEEFINPEVNIDMLNAAVDFIASRS